MGASNYLAEKTNNKEFALRAAIYTFCAYMITCIILISPFCIFKNRATILTVIVLMAILIIFAFNRFFYRQNMFYRHFFEMLSICTIVSTIAFFIGEIAGQIFGI